MRGSLVHGEPLDRLPARRPAEANRADGARSLRRLHDALRPTADAGTGGTRAGLALRRGPAAGRSDAPPRDPSRWPVRQAAAQPERGAAEASRSVEIRVQGDQVHREYPPYHGAAAHDLERCRAQRGRLLRKREPRRGPPALEPGHRATHRRAPAAPHTALQWLREPGGEPLRRDGLAPLLLGEAPWRR